VDLVVLTECQISGEAEEEKEDRKDGHDGLGLKVLEGTVVLNSHSRT
jgi:hypothetical protein